MEALRESWTDERLDDLHTEVRDLRSEMRDEFHQVRTEMRDEFRQVRAEVKAGFESTTERFDRVNDKFDSLHRTLIWLCGGLLVSFSGALWTYVLTQA
jgi:ElaB/YqjD/DUF883 family membrane-anchored ribosome-binding protein